MARDPDPLVAEMHALESSLWRAQTRFDAAHLERVLHPDFREVGRSGRTWTRAEIVAAPARPIPAELPLPGFAARQVDHSTVLVTYVSTVGAELAHRSSVWVGRPGERRLLFHQGTPTTPRT